MEPTQKPLSTLATTPVPVVTPAVATATPAPATAMATPATATVAAKPLEAAHTSNEVYLFGTCLFLVCLVIAGVAWSRKSWRDKE